MNYLETLLTILVAQLKEAQDVQKRVEALLSRLANIKSSVKGIVDATSIKNDFVKLDRVEEEITNAKNDLVAVKETIGALVAIRVLSDFYVKEGEIGRAENVVIDMLMAMKVGVPKRPVSFVDFSGSKSVGDMSLMWAVMEEAFSAARNARTDEKPEMSIAMLVFSLKPKAVSIMRNCCRDQNGRTSLAIWRVADELDTLSSILYKDRFVSVVNNKEVLSVVIPNGETPMSMWYEDGKIYVNVPGEGVTLHFITQ